jgi:hypothetical protein
MATKQRPTRSAVSLKKPAAKVSARPSKPARPVAARKTAAPAKTAARPKGNGAVARAAGKGGSVKPKIRPAVVAKLAVPAPPVRVPVVPSVPAGPSSHDLAMEVFEKGFRALQVRNFKEAAKTLASIIERYPDEKELHERARVYIAICERQSDPKRDQAPRTTEERMNAATVAVNRGAYADALGFLRAIANEDSESDVVHYMMAVAHAGLGDPNAAIPHLQEAIELNPENRFLALQDSDLDPIRGHQAFVALLDSPPLQRRRPATRARSTR